jgi:hypothetical protein
MLATDLNNTAAHDAGSQGRQPTWLSFIHGGVRIRFGGWIVVGLSPLAFTDFALVFALLALGGLQFVALVAAETEMCVGARTLRFLCGVFHCGDDFPVFPGYQRKLRLQ